FAEALQAARLVLDDQEATQAEVDKALARLNDARSKLNTGNVPVAPQHVVAMAGDRRADLSWAASEVDGGARITDYVIQFTTDDGETWATVDEGIATTTILEINGLTNNTRYRFRVAAVNAAGTGPISEATSVVVPTIPV